MFDSIRDSVLRYTDGTDFTHPATIVSFVVVGFIVLFVFIYNNMTMRRRQLDRKIAHVRAILLRRRELAEIVRCGSGKPAESTLQMLERDAGEAQCMTALGETADHKNILLEYRSLAELLEQVLPECRAELRQYNDLVGKPDTKWLTKLLRLLPREEF